LKLELRWAGATVVCVASGPTAAAIDLEAARGRARVIAINDSWRLAPFADVLYGCDGEWWSRPYDPGRGWPSAEAFAGVRVTQDLHAAERLGLRRVMVTRGVDRILTAQAGVIGSGSNSGFQAVNLAVQAGARRVVLVGYDYRDDLGLHWHGRHPPGLNNPKAPMLARWAAALDGQAAALKALNVEVLNTSPVSALTAFRKIDLEGALNGDRAERDVSARRDLGARLHV